jgi:2-oxoglutarate dehydrogenase E1 component
MDFPKMLCIWDAQFGDFANGAQVIIDQFIASSETKWLRPSSLVMLLPHGYEGMGPEHSSGRLERFLQLCAHENMQVCNLTTPAQYFHLLRRQMKRVFRKPLIIMTPKKLLRLKQAVSRREDFTEGSFQEILLGPRPLEPQMITRLIFCSGKVYYDLLEYQQSETGRGYQDHVLLIRVEQLYPFHQQLMEELVTPYLKNNPILVWCQEEPENMGAYEFMKKHLEALFHQTIIYAGREASSSTAVGALALHHIEQARLVSKAFIVTESRL